MTAGPLDDALRLAALGLPIFPAKEDKTPLLAESWKTAATTDTTKITQWWTDYPEALIALPVPSSTVVIDIDDAEQFASSTFASKLPATVTQTTRSGGSHWFYQTDGTDLPQTVRAYDPSFDTRVGGKGYVIAWEPDKLSGLAAWSIAPTWLYDVPKAGMDGGGQHDQLIRDAGRLWNHYQGETHTDMLWSIAKRLTASDPSKPWTYADCAKITKSFEDGGYASKPKDTQRQTYTLSEFVTMEFPPDRWRIDGMMQTVGTGAFIAARKHGKSLSFMQMAMCIAGGIDYLGYKVEQAPVLLIEQEGGPPFYQDQLKRQIHALGLDGRDIPLTIAHRQELALEKSETIDWIRSLIDRTGAKVILAGPMSKLATMKDTYKPEEWNVIGKHIDSIVTQFNCMMMVAHHTRKGNKPESIDDMMDTSLGSTALSGLTDTMMALWRPPEQTEGVLYLMSRNADSKRIGVELDKAGLIYKRNDAVLEDAETRKRGKVFEWLWNEGAWASEASIVTGVEMSRTSVRRYLSELELEGQIDVDTQRIGKMMGKVYKSKAPTF